MAIGVLSSSPEMEFTFWTKLLFYFLPIVPSASFFILFAEDCQLTGELFPLKLERQLSPAPGSPSHITNAKLQLISDSHARKTRMYTTATFKICCYPPPELANQSPTVLHSNRAYKYAPCNPRSATAYDHYLDHRGKQKYSRWEETLQRTRCAS